MIIPAAARRRIERRIIAAARPPSEGGFILEWLPRHSVFIAICALDNVSWDNGHVACIITQADAVKMELLIAEKTAPTIDKLLATAKPTLNLIIGDIDGAFKYGHIPRGVAAAVITNDLQAAVTAKTPVEFTWAEIQDAVRFVQACPPEIVNKWRRKLGKGGVS